MSWDVLLHLTGDYLTLTVHLRTEGQEIYKGENSGIEHWNTALNKGNKDWKVVCPDKLKHVFAGHNVMETKDAAALDLTVSLRTHLAGDVSSFTNSLIDGDIQRARTFIDPIYKAGFSMFITRDLQAEKDYCNSRYAGNLDKRYGLIASSKGRDLPKFGVDNSFYGAINRGRYGKWFNTPKGSGGSCCDLVGVVTEFGIQGLELDMPIVCWNRDMIWNGSSWDKFKYNQADDSDDNVYHVNSYRVLLTRGRDDFIVFVPPTAALDNLYSMFKQIGIKELGVTTSIPVAHPSPQPGKPTPVKPAGGTKITGDVAGGNTLKEFFEANGLTTFDKRANGGCLWVLGDEKTIGKIVDAATKRFGVRGNYGSGRVTKGYPGWWTKSEK